MTRSTEARVRMCAATLVILFLLAGPAQARVNVTQISAHPIAANAPCSLSQPAPAFTQAGAHSDLCIALAMKSATPDSLGNSGGFGDDTRDIRLSLARGQVGSPRAVPLCSISKFKSANGCSSASQVGTVTARAETIITVDERLLQGKIYLLEQTGTEAARVGVQIDAAVVPGVLQIPAIKLQAEMRLRPEDNGIYVIVKDAPRDFVGIPIELRRMAMRMWGSPKDHPNLKRAFLSAPTDCSQPAVTKVELTSYAGDVTTASDQYTPTDCATLPNTINVSLDTERTADTTTAVTANVTAPDNDVVNGRGGAHFKKATLTLPVGFNLSAAGASEGLEGCTEAQFGLGKGDRVTCPPLSRIGTVEFASPLLLVDKLSGPIYMAEPVPGKKLRFFATAEAGPEDDALRVKVEANATINPENGQLVTTLDDLPPTPFTLFRFQFRGGPTAILSTPRTCGSYVAEVSATTYSQQPELHTTGATPIDQNCVDPQPFAPELTASVENTQAGADAPVVATLGRPDGNARLAGASVTLPPGLGGRLGADTCTVPDARAGNCPAVSRLGSVLAGAGVGPKPLVLPGEVYLTDGFDGSPAGLAIIANAKVGPLDFGKLVVLARIDVGADASIKMTFVDVPTRMEGIPLNLRTLRLALDKPGFTMNATSCAPALFKATLLSDLGSTADLTSPYQPTGCDQLTYAPKLSTEIVGARKDVLAGGHPKLRAVLDQPAGQANSKALALTLPAGLSVDVTKLASVCPLATFEAGQCSEGSVLGTLKAVTPVLPEPLSGIVRFVSVPGAPLPQLRMQLRGRINLDLTGTVQVDSKARLVTTLDPIPDTPITRFEMELGGKPDSPLVIGKDMCANAANPVSAKFTAWSGASAATTSQLRLPACTATATLKVSSLKTGKPSADLKVVAGQTRVDQVTLGLPSGLSFASLKSLKSRVKVSATNAGKKKATVTVSGGRLRVTFPKGVKATTARVRLTAGSIRVSPRLRRANRPRLTFTVGARKPGAKTANNLRVATRAG